MREIFFRWRAVCTRTWAYKWTLNLICRYTLRCLSRTTHAIASYCASLLACSGHFTGAQRGRRGDRARMRAFPRAHKIECQAWVDTLLTRTVRSYKHRWADSKSLASRTAAQYVYSCRWCRCSQRRPHLRGSPRSILILALSLMRRPLLRHAHDTPNRPTQRCQTIACGFDPVPQQHRRVGECIGGGGGGGGSGAKLLMASPAAVPLARIGCCCCCSKS